MSGKLSKLRNDDYGHVESLENYLYSDISNPQLFKINNRNLQAMISSYDKDRMVSFIGAGTSKPLGISDWKELMKRLIYVANENGFAEKFEDFEDKPSKWPNLAQEIYDYLKSNNRIEIYYNVIKQNMYPTINSATLTLVKLILAINFHLTTNFDTSIENAYEFLKIISKYFGIKEVNISFSRYFIPNFSLDWKKINALICYLHGNKDKNLYILKTEDYDTYYPSISNKEIHDASLEDFLKYCYKNKIIIFLGLSFQDSYLKKFFFNLAKKIELEKKASTDFYQESGQVYPEKEIRHFYIVDEEILNEYGENIHHVFNQYKIKLIIYKRGEHIFIEKLFDNIIMRDSYA